MQVRLSMSTFSVADLNIYEHDLRRGFNGEFIAASRYVLRNGGIGE